MLVAVQYVRNSKKNPGLDEKVIFDQVAKAIDRGQKQDKTEKVDGKTRKVEDDTRVRMTDPGGTDVLVHLGEITTLGHMQRMGPGHLYLGTQAAEAVANFLYGLGTFLGMGYEIHGLPLSKKTRKGLTSEQNIAQDKMFLERFANKKIWGNMKFAKWVKKPVVTETSIEDTILAPFKVARRKVGKPLPQEATEGICDGTCGVVTGRLKKEGFAYGKADIRAKSPLGDWVVGHVVALARINGETYIINQPQGEFMGSDFNIDNVWEDVFDPYRDIIKTTVPGDMREHHAVAGINVWEMLTGKENIIDTDFGPMDVNQVENIQTYTENGETWKEANFIADKEAKIRWNENTETIEFRSSKAPAVFTNENFTPRLIKVDAKTIAKAYGVDIKTAKENVAEINKIRLKSGKDISINEDEIETEWQPKLRERIGSPLWQVEKAIEESAGFLPKQIVDRLNESLTEEGVRPCDPLMLSKDSSMHWLNNLILKLR
jgi:hypothetical protein